MASSHGVFAVPWGGFVVFCCLFGLPKSNIAMEHVSQTHVVQICIFGWHESHKGENSVKIEYFDLFQTFSSL